LATSLTFSRAEKTLIVVFLLTLPFIQPRVRDDGIGYYAFARSLLVDHNLQFRGDWKDPRGVPTLIERDNLGRPAAFRSSTSTGHIPNFYPVGPAMLWSPFLVLTHGAVLAARRLGSSSVAADGFSRPYLIAMATSTALYGFLGLWLSFQLARDYFEESWALAATLGIWFASSLPVYMYADPSWSHAHSVFAVSLFLWYWHRTREQRTLFQWITLGLIAGLMLDVYFANSVFLVVPLLEALPVYRRAVTEGNHPAGRVMNVLSRHLAFCVAVLAAFAPTLIIRQIIFGHPLAVGAYANSPWNWTHPAFWSVLGASQHGLLSSTPILIPAIVGIFWLPRRVPVMGRALAVAALAFYLLIAVYPWWDGIESFGNRFFVSLTPIFILGLAAAFSEFARRWRDPLGARRRVATVLAMLILWNLGLVFQWGTGLMPSVGPVYWSEVLYNQFRVVPGEVLRALHSRFIG
jgi:hypothetical protein